MLQLVREAVQAEKDAMAERLLHTFQSLKGLMHAQPFDERCNDASKDIMATLLTPQPAAPSAALLGLSAACQPINGAPASIGYAAFVGDAGHQVCSHACYLPLLSSSPALTCLKSAATLMSQDLCWSAS